MSHANEDLLDEARRAYESRDWPKAFEAFGRCDGLEAEDLERMGWSALWSGRYGEVLDVFERSHAAFAARQDRLGAARTALALSQCNWDQRNTAVAQGWLGRAEELLEGLPESSEHGLLLWQRGRRVGYGGDVQGQERQAEAAYRIGVRVGNRDIQALGLLDQGAARVARGSIAEGVALLDRAAALAAAGDLEPGTMGVVYCGVIYACRCRGDWSRAREWTDTANRWQSRTRIAYFPGLCRMHRAEVLRMKGDYEEAEKESLASVEELLSASPQVAGIGLAELGEVRRRRGDLAGAMEAFRRALEHSWEPQPGLSRLLLAQGDARSAQQALDRVFGGEMPTWLREDMTSLLAARVTIALAAGQTETAAKAAAELEELAGRTAASADLAAAAHARAEIALAEGDAAGAIDRLIVARRLWIEMEAPYEVAGTRVLLARALDLSGDRPGAIMELEAAVGCYSRIGADLDRRRVEALLEAARRDLPGTAPSPVTVKEVAGLSREGDYWSLTLAGRTLRMKDSLGMNYIATLLASPGVEFLAADLAYGSGGAASAETDPALPVSKDSDAGERLDARAASEYRQRLDELRHELSAAEARGDAEAVGQAREEMEFLAGELACAFGLGGRARRDGSRAERARQSVTKAIRKILRRVEEEDPEIGRLLSTTIKTGTFCRYEPDPRVSWQL